MSTPVQGGPTGPLGYAPRRAREAGTAGAGAVSLPQELQDTPPRIVTSPRDEGDSPLSRETAPSRDSARESVAARGMSLRDALSARDGLTSRDPPPRRDTPSLREALSSRDGLRSRELPALGDSLDNLSVADGLTARSAQPQRDPPQIRDALSALERLTARGQQMREGSLPPVSREPSPARPARSKDRPSRETTSLRDALPFRDDPLSHEGIFPPLRPEPPQVLLSDAPRDLLDDTVDLDLAPAAASRSRTADPTWKRKKRPADVFEGDAALKELRSRLASAPSDQAPEPPVAAAAKTPMFASAIRLVGVVGLAAGGALGFLWITSPHGFRSAAPQTDEVALVSLGGGEPAKVATQNIAADPAPAPDQQQRWSVANYTGDAADRAVTPPVVPPVRTPGPPPRPPMTRAVPAPSPPPPEAVAPAPPPPAMPAPVPAAIAVPAPAPAAVAPADRDEINAMLVRARNFLSSGDVAAARVVLRRAAERDDAQAALALGGTYDPTVLKRLGIIGFHHPDASLAREWYKKAAALGSTDASVRLDQMAQTDH
jgi:hypothetical protein